MPRLDDEQILDEISAWPEPRDEAAVRAYARPLLRFQNGRLQPPASPELRRRMRATLPLLERRLRAVGRVVDAKGKSVGTAWLTSSNYAITTAAAANALRGGEGAVEFPDLRVRVEDVVLNDADAGLAVLRVEDDAELPQPIPITLDPATDVLVAYEGLYAAPGRMKGDKHDANAKTGVILDVGSGAAVGMLPAITAKTIRAKAKRYVNVVSAPPPVESSEVPEELGEEAAATPADYVDRKGFDPNFLGDGKLRVKLPTSTAHDTLEFTLGKKKSTELKYMHFSVVMSKSRQLCLYSAVNIDGKLSKKAPRPAGWQKDPRIEQSQQVFGDVYGNSPRFSRGHMTRREDPIWGTKEEAAVGNRDSMHFTNAAPQMQPFNAPVWLALENYALQNARKDDQRITVMTGPFFSKKDPVKFGVRIPVEFWKIIAFVHDDTGELTCTGYTMSQEDFLSPLEFVFGEFKQAQVPVALIEKRARLSFHGLAKRDPLAKEESAFVPLTDVRQVRFV